MSSSPYRGIPIVVSGPSGVGKTTVIDQVLSRYQDIVRAVTTTTRPLRPGEVHGKDYFFLSPEEFKQGLEQDLFIEHAVVHDNYYGTPRAKLEEQLDQGVDVLLVIDIQGGAQIKSLLPEALLIFLLPPDMETLEARLRLRSQDPDDQIATRLQNAEEELAFAKFYDYWVVNESLEETVRQVRSIIEVDRCRVDRAADRLGGLGFKLGDLV